MSIFPLFLAKDMKIRAITVKLTPEAALYSENGPKEDAVILMLLTMLYVIY